MDKMMTDLEFENWVEYCQNATDSQLLEIMKQEYENQHIEHARLAQVIAIMRSLMEGS